MSECKRFQYLIELKLYEEISHQEKIELESHLDDCNTCIAYQASSEKMKNMLSQQDVQQPSDTLMNDVRSDLSQLLRAESILKPSSTKGISRFFEAIFKTPGLQVGFAMLLMIIGFSGGYFVNGQFHNQPEHTINQSENVFFAGIEHIDHSPADQSVTLMYRTIHEHVKKGKSSDPEIQEFLIKTLLLDTRDSARLKAVQTLSLSDTLTPFTQKALIRILGEEDNTAIKLKTIKMVQRFINKIDQQQTIVSALANLALKEQNSAVQNEIVKSMLLSNDPNIYQTVQQLSEAVENDYILSVFKKNQERNNQNIKELTW